MYAGFYDAESGRLKQPLLNVVNLIEETVKKKLLANLRRKTTGKQKKDEVRTSDPFQDVRFFTKINSSWKELFVNHVPMKEAEFETLRASLASVCGELARPPFAEQAQPFLEFEKRARAGSERVAEQLRELRKTMAVVRVYNAKLEDENSFYRAVCLGYLEQLVTDKPPFKLLYSFLLSVKAQGEIEILPISQKASIKPSSTLDFKGWLLYVTEQLMRLAARMWTLHELANQDTLKVVDELLRLFNEDQVFQLGLAMLLRQKALQLVRDREKMEDCRANLSDIDAQPIKQAIKTVIRALKVAIDIYDKENREKMFQFEPSSSELAPIVLLKEGSFYSLLYSKKTAKWLFPKLLELNEDTKSRLCCECGGARAEQHGNCKDYYCEDCLDLLLKRNKGVALKCPRCEKSMGNQQHLLDTSTIRATQQQKKRKGSDND